MQAEALFSRMITDMAAHLRQHPLRCATGNLESVVANRMTTRLPGLVIGHVCRLEGEAHKPRLAQVVGLEARGGAVLAPLGSTEGLSPRTRVIPLWRALRVACGQYMLGGVFDGLGNPMGDTPAGPAEEFRGCLPVSVDPLDRPVIEDAVASGIRAVDAFATIGQGQRVAVFGAAGSGKTSLLGMLARNFSSDVVVLALIGERGREVREFIDRQLPPEIRQRCVIIVSTSDRPAMERVSGAHIASTVAEFFRDQGRNVLLIFDSVTRFARALREVGLAAGEEPVRRGFPPSVYAELPRLIERSGRAAQGSISGIYSVLSESEAEDDPIVEEVKSLTDGHIHLAKALAQKGHFPAIDVLKSASRLMPAIVTPAHLATAQKVRELIARYADLELLLQVGEYRPGQDALSDQAVAAHPLITGYLKQAPQTVSRPQDTLERLAEIAGGWVLE